MHAIPCHRVVLSCAVAETGTIPPGNAPGETKWQSRTAKPARPEIRLTAGKGITGTTMDELIDRVVKDIKVSRQSSCRAYLLTFKSQGMQDAGQHMEAS